MPIFVSCRSCRRLINYESSCKLAGPRPKNQLEGSPKWGMSLGKTVVRWGAGGQAGRAEPDYLLVDSGVAPELQ
jgi:hypothetical protein